MSQDSANQNANSSKCSPVVLLLFVGFIFGLITGFLTKDPVMRSYLKVISSMSKESDLSQPIDTGAATSVIIEDTEQIVVPKPEEEEKKEEEKKEGDAAQPAGTAAPAATGTPAPAPTPVAN